MPVTINDNRRYLAMSVEDADSVMREIAEAETSIAELKAKAERRIADAKAEYADQTESLELIIRQRAAVLERYIAAHPERFAKPRARRSNWGEYGLRSVSSIEIEDIAALTRYAERHHLAVLRIETTLDRKAVAAELAKGVELPGVCRVSGERAFYKVSKALIDDAKKRGAES